MEWKVPLVSLSFPLYVYVKKKARRREKVAGNLFLGGSWGVNDTCFTNKLESAEGRTEIGNPALLWDPSQFSFFYCFIRSTDIFDYTYIDAFGKGKQLTVKECEYLIGHHVTEEFYGVVTSKEVLQRMVGNLLNLGKRWVEDHLACKACGEKGPEYTVCISSTASSQYLSECFKKVSVTQGILKILYVTLHCLFAFNHLQQHCVETIFSKTSSPQENG